jgi:hypothetical protein
MFYQNGSREFPCCMQWVEIAHRKPQIKAKGWREETRFRDLASCLFVDIEQILLSLVSLECHCRRQSGVLVGGRAGLSLRASGSTTSWRRYSRLQPDWRRNWCCRAWGIGMSTAGVFEIVLHWVRGSSMKPLCPIAISHVRFHNVRTAVTVLGKRKPSVSTRDPQWFTALRGC